MDLWIVIVLLLVIVFLIIIVHAHATASSACPCRRAAVVPPAAAATAAAAVVPPAAAATRRRRCRRPRRHVHVCVDYTSGPPCLRRLHVQASTATRALATTRLCASPASHTCTACRLRAAATHAGASRGAARPTRPARPPASTTTCLTLFVCSRTP